MLQTLLADRFKLTFHRETRQLPVYTPAVAKNGPKFKEANPEEKSGMAYGNEPGMVQRTFRKSSLGTLINLMANMLESPVMDKTGLTGQYDFKIEWALAGPDRRASRPSKPDPLFSQPSKNSSPKFEVHKGPGEVMVIDHAEHASEN